MMALKLPFLFWVVIARAIASSFIEEQTHQNLEERQVQGTVYPTTTLRQPTPTCTKVPLQSLNPINQPYFAYVYENKSFRTFCAEKPQGQYSFLNCQHLCSTEPSFMASYDAVPSGYGYCVNEGVTGRGPFYKYTYPNGVQKDCIKCPSQLPSQTPSPGGVAVIYGTAIRGTCGTQRSRKACPWLCNLTPYEVKQLGFSGTRCSGQDTIFYDDENGTYYQNLTLYWQFFLRNPCTPCQPDCPLFGAGSGSITGRDEDE